MEEKQGLTSRKRKRIEWWTKHSPKKEQVKKKSVDTEMPIKEIPEKEDSVEKKSTSTQFEIEEKQSKRYILFIGNMPFTVKEEDVKSHFRCTGKDSINDVRLMTKKTGESKGCGFIEFNNKDSYWKALNLHHSVLGGRKINVEVTCGGGGKGEKRGKRLQERKTKFRQGRKTKSKTSKVKLKQKDNSAANTSNGN